jgi:hypothetical protein
MNSIQRQARVAGILYLGLLIAPIGLLYVPGKLIVSGNAAATAENLRNSESLLRLGIATELIHQVIAVFLVLALYRLFKPVSETLARQVVVLGALVSVPIMFVNVLNEIAAQVLASGPEFLTALDQGQRDALASLFLHLHGEGIAVASVFWGLWLFPFGLLVLRSGFIPRVLGVLLILAGVGNVASAFATLVLPPYAEVVSRVALPLILLEIPMMFWLAIWGARPRSTDAPAPPESQVSTS